VLPKSALNGFLRSGRISPPPMSQPTATPSAIRHTRWVKATHWIVSVSFLLLAFSGFVILMCHPRLYWGEVGNDLTPALIELPISRNHQHGGWTNSLPFFRDAPSPVSASRTYEIFNQNGWGRSLHFLAAWFLVLPGAVIFWPEFSRATSGGILCSGRPSSRRACSGRTSEIICGCRSVPLLADRNTACSKDVPTAPSFSSRCPWRW